jgi:leucyl aminopeptidase
MEAMKYDMSGGATVLGTMRAIGLLKPTVPVLGIVAAVENMPGQRGNASERCCHRIERQKPSKFSTPTPKVVWFWLMPSLTLKRTGATRIVDMATLTGAVIIALGDLNTAVLGNDQELVDEIIECGKEMGENFWQLPIGKNTAKR